MTQRYLPVLYHRRVARHVRKFAEVQTFPFQRRIGEILFEKADNAVVLSGPFKGMRYLNEVFCSSATPRWLGTYELELHSTIEEICKKGYRTILNVGSAEGYYAVGFARRSNNTNIYAFDVDPWSRTQCRKLSEINGVASRVFVNGLLEGKNIARFATLPACILCDIEGYEFLLLDPEKFPVLRQCDLLVEVHEFTEFGNGVAQTLSERFKSTHNLKMIEAAPRPLIAIVGLFPDGTSHSDIEQAMDEGRPEPQQWLWMTRR